MSTERNPTIEIEKDIYEKIKNIAKENRKKIKPFVNDILLGIIENGYKKDTKNSDVERLTIERNTYKNLVEDLSKSWLGVDTNEYLKLEVSKDGKPLVIDSQINKTVEIDKKFGSPYCTYHKASSCNHINFILYKTMLLGLETFGEKYNLKKS